MNKAIGKTSSCYNSIWSATPSAAQRRLEAERFGKRVGGTKGTSDRFELFLKSSSWWEIIPVSIWGGFFYAPGAFEGQRKLSLVQYSCCVLIKWFCTHQKDPKRTEVLSHFYPWDSPVLSYKWVDIISIPWYTALKLSHFAPVPIPQPIKNHQQLHKSPEESPKMNPLSKLLIYILDSWNVTKWNTKMLLSGILWWISRQVHLVFHGTRNIPFESCSMGWSS
jgi:hypothetical protein